MEDYLLKCVNYSIEPVRFDGTKFVYLYETTNLCNGHIYIGVRVYDGNHPENDHYIGNGCGIRVKSGALYKRKGKETYFRRELSKWGYLNFKKKIICYFTSLDDALLSEKNIVNEDFLARKDVMNMVEGGGFPPYGCGESNSNYGHYWTEEQKQALSKKRKKRGKSKGANNPKATECWVYDLWTDKIHHLPFMNQAVQMGLVDRLACGMNRLYNFRYLFTSKEVGDVETYLMENCKPKYRDTYKLIQLVKSGKTRDEIHEMGIVNGGFLGRFFTKYDKYVEDNKN